MSWVVYATGPDGALLRHQKERGILRSVKDPQHGWFDLWEIAV